MDSGQKQKKYGGLLTPIPYDGLGSEEEHEEGDSRDRRESEVTLRTLPNGALRSEIT